MLVIGSLLNITNINIAAPLPPSRRLGVQTSGVTGWQSLYFHAVFSILMFSACITVPITLMVLSNREFEQLKDRKSS
jgi:hypothetical protein